MNKNDQSVKRMDWIIYFDEKNESVSCVPVGSREAAHLDVPMIKGFNGTMAEALKEVRRISNDYSDPSRKKRRLRASW